MKLWTALEIYNKLHPRIHGLVNHGLEICSEYIPDTSSSYQSKTCSDCGYSQEIHLIRDARDFAKQELK